MDRRERSRVAGVKKLKQIERFAAANFAQNDAVGPMPKGGFQKIADGDGWQAVLRLPRLEADKVRLGQMDLGGVLDEQNPFILRDEFSENIEQSSFCRCRFRR